MALNLENPTASELHALLNAFERCILPKEEWTHTAHLLVGLMMLWRAPAHEALEDLREAIRTYNLSVGTANTASSGHHETITRFYVAVIAAHLQSGHWDDPAKAAIALLRSPVAERQYPLQFYSRERLFCSAARQEWCEPDLQTLRLGIDS